MDKIVPKNQPVLKFQLRSKMQSQIRQTNLPNTFVRKISKKIAAETKASEDMGLADKFASLCDKKAVIKNSKKVVYISKESQSKHA